jgi:Ca2+-binding RTX toxin-like protein
MIDPLEKRRLLAAALGDDGVLNVNGTGSSDEIVVQIIDRRLAVFINGARERFTLSSVDRLSINGQGGNDRIDFRTIATPATARGGAGADAIIAGTGDDRLYGDSGNDQLYGGDGSDRLDGGTGSDLLSGGAGRDSVDYSARTANLSITIKRGNYDDGERNERDNVREDIEGINGGSGDDAITGWISPDVINGNAGNDTIKGDDAQDSINGDDGDDLIEGNDNNDRLSGGNGDDFLEGGRGSNVLYGNAGNDLFDSENGYFGDTVDGGSGDDEADIDFRISFDLIFADRTHGVEWTF